MFHSLTVCAVEPLVLHTEMSLKLRPIPWDFSVRHFRQIRVCHSKYAFEYVCLLGRPKLTEQTHSRLQFPFRLIERVFSMEDRCSARGLFSPARAHSREFLCPSYSDFRRVVSQAHYPVKCVYFEASHRGELLTFVAI